MGWHMVPAPAVFVIGDDDQSAIPRGAVWNTLHQISRGLLA
jgi:hypothetical protein